MVNILRSQLLICNLPRICLTSQLRACYSFSVNPWQKRVSYYVGTALILKESKMSQDMFNTSLSIGDGGSAG